MPRNKKAKNYFYFDFEQARMEIQILNHLILIYHYSNYIYLLINYYLNYYLLYFYFHYLIYYLFLLLNYSLYYFYLLYLKIYHYLFHLIIYHNFRFLHFHYIGFKEPFRMKKKFPVRELLSWIV